MYLDTKVCFATLHETRMKDRAQTAFYH